MSMNQDTQNIQPDSCPEEHRIQSFHQMLEIPEYWISVIHVPDRMRIIAPFSAGQINNKILNL